MLIGESMLNGLGIALYIAFPIISLWWTIVAICERDILGILLSIVFGWFLFIAMTLYFLGV